MQYYSRMIRSFKDDRTEALFHGRCARQFQPFGRIAQRKLKVLDAVTKLDDLRIPPGNRLEALKGNRKGQMSIRINDQYRICFRWEDGSAYEVEIVDYHH